MWVKVDDGLPEHWKVFAAAERLGGPHNYARILAMWLQAMCYSNRNLTDGFLPVERVKRFHDPRAIDAAEALAADGVRLWERVEGGYRIHDYDHYQPDAEKTKEIRKRRSAAGRKGGLASAAARRTKTDSNTQAHCFNFGSTELEASLKQNRTPIPIPVPVQSNRDEVTACTSPEKAAAAPLAHAVETLKPKELPLIGLVRRDAPTERTVEAVVRDVAAHLPRGLEDEDLVEAVKVACARLRFDYQGDVVHRAIDSERAKAAKGVPRRSGFTSIGDIAANLRRRA